MRLLFAIIGLIVLVVVGGGWYLKSGTAPPSDYRTAKMIRGDLLSTVDATGTLEPEEVVDVGAQVDGLIDSFGKDSNGNPVDYRSPVQANMVLAHIDDATYRADLSTAQAQLDTGKSNLEKGVADVDQAKAKMHQAEQNWIRAQQLGVSDALSKSDYETYQADFETARANVAVAQAEISQAKATIHAAEAALSKAQRNLDFCTIRSPVKGEIIDRRVNIGQTVVSSLSASSMFLIAKDLSRMQVWAAVNEADVDHIKPGQDVTFTCDALQGETFKGTVGKVRLNAQSTQNVVVYTVEVNVDNGSGRLLPYMTANVQFNVHRDANVLLAPNAALRWYPSDAKEVVPDARSKWKPIEDEDEQPAASPGAQLPVKALKKKIERHGTIWVAEGRLVRPIDVKLGPTDSVNTEVSPGTPEELSEGAQIVVGDAIGADSSSDERDPFLPRLNQKK